MPFSWVADITVGNIERFTVLQELRTNADWVDNNTACVGHNTTILTTQYTTNHASYLTSVLGGYYGGYYANFNMSD